MILKVILQDIQYGQHWRTTNIKKYLYIELSQSNLIICILLLMNNFKSDYDFLSVFQTFQNVFWFQQWIFLSIINKTIQTISLVRGRRNGILKYFAQKMNG